MKTKKLVFSALFAALTCVMTMLIKIPSPLKGYLNLGDFAVLLSGRILGSAFGFAAAGIGSALAAIFSGYAFYAPATFVIKGVMALIVYALPKITGRKKSLLFCGISAALAELFMALAYYVFEGFLYGFYPALLNIPANLLQGVIGVVLGLLAINFFEKNHII